MDFLKKYLPVLALVGGFVALSIPSFFLLRNKISQRESVKVMLDDKIKERQALWDRKPFPSKENVELIKKGAKAQSEKIEAILSLLQQSHVAFPQKSGSEVKEQLVVAWRRMTQILDEGQVKHPEKFQFGFERYNNVPPKDVDTPFIQTQLEIVEELMKLLAKARIPELLSIRRVIFEDAPKSDPKAPVSSPGHWEPVVSSGGKFAIVESPEYLYKVFPFEMEFWCDTDSLRSFLNSVAVSKHVFLTRVLNIENEKKDPILASAIPVPPGTSPAAGGVPAAKVDPKSIDPFQLPFVMGMERIKVGMRIEWLDFLPEKISGKGGSMTLKSAPKPGAGNAR